MIEADLEIEFGGELAPGFESLVEGLARRHGLAASRVLPTGDGFSLHVSAVSKASLDAGIAAFEPAIRTALGARVVAPPHANVTYNTSVAGSVGALAVGHGASATNVTLTWPTQADHQQQMKDAQHALIEGQDELQATVVEALGQFLRVARQTQVENQRIADVQTRLQSEFEDILVRQFGIDVKPGLLRAGSPLANALLASPVVAEIIKAIVGG